MTKNDTITLQPLAPRFAICKVPDYSGADLSAPFCFTGATDEELSLVCPEEYVPDNALVRDDGWRAFRIIGQLDFSLTGILAGIAKALAVVPDSRAAGCFSDRHSGRHCEGAGG